MGNGGSGRSRWERGGSRGRGCAPRAEMQALAQRCPERCWEAQLRWCEAALRRKQSKRQAGGRETLPLPSPQTPNLTVLLRSTLNNGIDRTNWRYFGCRASSGPGGGGFARFAFSPSSRRWMPLSNESSSRFAVIFMRALANSSRDT